MKNKLARTTLKIIFYPVSLGSFVVGLGFFIQFIQTLSYPYNDMGNYFDGVINHHSGEGFVMLVIAIFCLIVSGIILFLLRRGKNEA